MNNHLSIVDLKLMTTADNSLLSICFWLRYKSEKLFH